MARRGYVREVVFCCSLGVVWDLFDHTESGCEVKMYSLYSYQLADQAFGNGIRKLHEQTNYAC